MIDLLCTKYLRVNVTLLAIKGIDTKLKENKNSQSTHTRISTSTRSLFKKAALTIVDETTVLKEISAYATFTSTGVLGIEEHNMLVSSNVVDQATNEVKEVIYWERESAVMSKDVVDHRDDDGDESTAKGGAPTVSIPVVLCTDKSKVSKKNGKKNAVPLRAEVISIDLGLLSRSNPEEKVNLGRASFVVSEEQCGSHSMSIPIRCNGAMDEERKRNNAKAQNKSILKRMKIPAAASRKRLSFASNPASTANATNSLRGAFHSREFKLSPNAVLQLLVDISYADDGKEQQEVGIVAAVASPASRRSIRSPIHSKVRTDEQKKQVTLDHDVLGDPDNNTSSIKLLADTSRNEKESKTDINTAGELVVDSNSSIKEVTLTESLESKPDTHKPNSNTKKNADREEQGYYNQVVNLNFLKLLEWLANRGETLEKIISNYSELLCHEPTDDTVMEHDDETMTKFDDDTRTYNTFEEEDTLFTYEQSSSKLQPQKYSQSKSVDTRDDLTFLTDGDESTMDRLTLDGDTTFSICTYEQDTVLSEVERVDRRNDVTPLRRNSSHHNKTKTKSYDDYDQTDDGTEEETTHSRGASSVQLSMILDDTIDKYNDPAPSLMTTTTPTTIDTADFQGKNDCDKYSSHVDTNTEFISSTDNVKFVKDNTNTSPTKTRKKPAVTIYTESITSTSSPY